MQATHNPTILSGTHGRRSRLIVKLINFEKEAADRFGIIHSTPCQQFLDMGEHFWQYQ